MAALLLTASAFAAFWAGVSAAPQNVPPKMSGNAQILGHTFDPKFVTGNASIPKDPGFYSDGGAGGFVNGYHMLTLSDARVRNSGGLVHTVYAFTAANDPTNITILGDYKSNPHFYLQGPNGAGQGVVASEAGDSCGGSTFGPAPNQRMVTLGGSKGATVWTVYCGKPVYNTLIEFDVANLEGLAANSQQIPNQRTVQKLFTIDQPQYGTDGLASDATYLYLVARNNQYFKLARVDKNSRTDLRAYQQYYPSSKSWKNNTIPNPNDTSTDTNFFISTAPGVTFTSDLFFSSYFNTWLISYNSNPYGAGLFNLAYSTSGAVEGPYQDVPGFFGPPIDEGCDSKSPNYNPASKGSFGVVYSAHAHPGYDSSGKTLIVGWISCNTFTNFAKVTFQ